MRFIPIAAAAALIAVAYAFDITKLLGAHPWWSRDVLIYGAPIGLGLAFAAGWAVASDMWRSLGFVVLSGAALATAFVGKSRFVASYAEDALAGQAWFFGWIAVALFVTAAVFSLAQWGLRPRSA